jgi:hypothetical protein
MPKQPGKRVRLRPCPALDSTIKRLKASGDVATASLLWRLVFKQTPCRVVAQSGGAVTLKVRGRRPTFAVPRESVRTATQRRST